MVGRELTILRALGRGLLRRASADVDGDKDGAFGYGKTPVKRGTLPNPVEGVPPIPKPPRRSMLEIASTNRVKPTSILSRLSITAANNNYNNNNGTTPSSSSSNFFTSSSRPGSPTISIAPSRSRQSSSDTDGSSYPPRWISTGHGNVEWYDGAGEKEG
jgi:hypothetical protein